MSRFRSWRPLGSGTCADVWRAHDDLLGRDVAIKVFHPADDSRIVAINHARALAKVPHANIVQVYEVVRVKPPGDHQSRDAIVMEVVEGLTVKQRLEKRPLDLLEADRICVALINAVEHVHDRGQAHYDLSTENVMVTANSAKVIDLYGTSKRPLGPMTLEQRQAHDRRDMRRLLVAVCKRTTPPVPLTFLNDLREEPTAGHARKALRATLHFWGSPEDAQRFSSAALEPLVQSNAPARLDGALETLGFMVNNNIPIPPAVEERLAELALDTAQRPTVRARALMRLRVGGGLLSRVVNVFTEEWLSSSDMHQDLSWEGYCLYAESPARLISFLERLENVPSEARGHRTMVDALGVIRNALQRDKTVDDAFFRRAATLARSFAGRPHTEIVVKHIVELSPSADPIDA